MITLYGRIPSKKNNKQIFNIKGRIIIASSKNYREWHKDASFQLKNKPKIKTPVSITIKFFFPDKRKSDLTNKAESIMDLLVDNGIIPDDNYNEIPKLLLEFGGVDKNTPRAEITWQ